MEPSGHSKLKIMSGCFFHRFCLYQVSSSGFLDTWVYLAINKNRDLKWWLKGGKGGSGERKRRTNNTLSLLFEPVPVMPVLPHGIRGEVPCVQCGFQGHSYWAHLSLCLFTQADAPAKRLLPPSPYFRPIPSQVKYSLNILRFQTKSLYEECTTWLFLNLAGLCKNICNETKKIVLMIIPEGMRGKWVGLMGLFQARDAATTGTVLFS